jgi:acetyl-CoA carboxylase biotin carboxyl carrier protein
MNDKKPKSPLDPEVVRELAALLEETGLSEIEIERDGMRVRVVKTLSVMAPMMAPMPAQSLATGAAPAPTAEPVRKKGTLVTSPMVGTIYLSPQPGAEPFVKVGDSVKDETLCIVEAMKTMNPVSAPTPGKIIEIYVRDGQPVEFGEPLMLID